MLKRIRIEVEEATAEECVAALMKYEHAIQQQEARRYRHLWPLAIAEVNPITDGDQVVGHHFKETDEGVEYPTPDQPWDDGYDERGWFNDHFGREVTEEVIKYDESLPGYVGRRVVQFKRIDMRGVVESYMRMGEFGFTFGGGGLGGSNAGSATASIRPRT